MFIICMTIMFSVFNLAVHEHNAQSSQCVNKPEENRSCRSSLPVIIVKPQHQKIKMVEA